MDTDVLVIGAGLAGLTCAVTLQAAGRNVQIIDAADAPGGRVRTDVINNFRCDRGFQLLNPAYPMVKELIDLPALDLAAFGTGVVLRQHTHSTALKFPLTPHEIATAAKSGILNPLELARFTSWIAPAITHPDRLTTAPDTSLAQSLDAARITGNLRTGLIEPFLAGVLADTHGSQSANFTKYLIAMFAKGRPSLPANGMGALPQQLADRLLTPVQVNTRAEKIQDADHKVTVETNNGPLTAQKVVLATDTATARSLTNRQTRPAKGLTTWWFSTDTAPHAHKYLTIDGRPDRNGPVTNTAVVSNVAPSYAPAGQHLIQATQVLGSHSSAATETTVREHLRELYNVDTRPWEVITTHHIDAALPDQPAPWRPQHDFHHQGATWVCGDSTTGGSIQHAMASGTSVANQILADFRNN